MLDTTRAQISAKPSHELSSRLDEAQDKVEYTRLKELQELVKLELTNLTTRYKLELEVRYPEQLIAHKN